MPNRSTGFTPFFMAFSSEAVLPTELEYGSLRVRSFNEEDLERARQDSVDQLDEARDLALLRSAKYQQALRRYHLRRAQPRTFHVEDLVLRRIQTNKNKHKLSPPWEGPYVVVETLRPGAYRLKDADGNIFPNAWNIEQLRRFYP